MTAESRPNPGGHRPPLQSPPPIVTPESRSAKADMSRHNRAAHTGGLVNFVNGLAKLTLRSNFLCHSPLRTVSV